MISPESPLKQRIRDLGERLDAHRKRQQELHPGLTLTGMYNVLEKLRGGDHRSPHFSASGDGSSPPLLTAKEKQLHDELDQAVLEAYGWGDLSRSVGVSPTSGDTEGGRDAHAPCDALLTRLVALNHARAAEEKRGLIRWLRPDYQNPNAAASQPIQTTLQGTDPDSSSSNQKSKIHNPQSSINPSSSPAWPERLPDQVTLIRQLLAQNPTATAEQLSARFGRKNPKRTEQIEGIIETLRGLGKV